MKKFVIVQQKGSVTKMIEWNVTTQADADFFVWQTKLADWKVLYTFYRDTPKEKQL